MSSPLPQKPKASFDWHGLPALIKEWKEVIVPVAGALATALTTIGIKAQGTAQIIAYAVISLLMSVGAYAAYNTRRKQKLARRLMKLRETFERRKLQRTAFRGLYPYQEGDVLPGHQRKREAQRIFTQITDVDFSFGVLCGASGCGKTSMLRCALQGLLKEAEAQTGFRVLYIRNPGELTNDLDKSNQLTPAMRLEWQLATIKRMAMQVAEGAPLVIIIDQFDQFFIEYKTELHAQLGMCMSDLIRTVRARIVCAVRRDYLMDMRSLAPHLPEPLSIKTLFTLENFTPEQATDVIKECAALDDVSLDSDLPVTLAKDLADGGDIRPPELQIVCTALLSNPTLAEYRKRGGAKGILSYHIQSAIEFCGDPKLGSQVLRALSDFPAHAKRNPQTLTALWPALDLPMDQSREQAAKAVTEILVQFEAARLVVIDQQMKEYAYSLVHDYLVDAVAIATSGAARTRIEEANQLLQYYIAEYSADRRITIPIRRKRFIKTYAHKVLLNEPRARQLFRATRNAQLRNITVLLLLVLFFSATVLTILNTRRTWVQTKVGQLFPEADTIFGGRIFRMRSREQVFSIAESPEGKFIKLWDGRTTKLLIEKKADDIFIDNTDQFLLTLDKTSHSVNAVELKSGDAYLLPISAAAIDASVNISDLVKLSASGEVALISRASTEQEPMTQTSVGKASKQGIKLWSIRKREWVGAVELAEWTYVPDLYLDKSGSRLLASYRTSTGGQWALWNANTGDSIAAIADTTPDFRFAVDEERHKFVVVTRRSSNQLRVQLLDLHTGEGLLEQFVSINERYTVAAAEFSSQGDFIILEVRTGETTKPLTILNTYDLLPAPQCGKELQWSYKLSIEEQSGVSWSDEVGTYFWDVTSNPPRLLPELILSPSEIGDGDGIPREKLLMNLAGDRAVVIRRRDLGIELYDLGNGRKISDIQQGQTGGQFTFDGNALDLLSGGTSMMYSLETGRKIAELENLEVHGTFHDAECRRINVWTIDGRVLRFTEGIELWGRWVWPWPITACSS